MFTPKQHNPALAAALILLASAFIAMTSLLAKALSTGAFGPALSPMQISHARFVFAFAVFLAAAAVLRPRIERPHWGLHIGRTICGWGGITLMFAAVGHIGLADATAISFLNPVFAMMLAIPLLGERVGPVRWTAAGIALTGMLILLRPTPDSFRPEALLALGAAAVMGMELIFIKRLTRLENIFQILLVNNFIGVCIASVAVLSVWQMPEPRQWLGLAAVGGLMACAQTAYINGMARADASFVAPFSYATLIFAALYDFGVFGVVPDWISVLGAGVILAGALLLAVREARVRGAAPLSVPVPQAKTDANAVAIGADSGARPGTGSAQD